MNPETETPLPFELGGNEELLWQCPMPRRPERTDWIIIGVLLLLTAACGVIFCVSGITEAGKIAAAFGGLFLFLLVLGLHVLLKERRSNRRTFYALTNKRACIIERPARPDGKCLVFSFEVHPHMIFKVKRHRNGTVDYLLGKERRGYVTFANGFRNLPPELDPAAAFARVGASIPAKGEKKRKTCEYTRPTPAAQNFAGIIILSCLFALALGLDYDNHGADLFLRGKETTATVVTYEQGTEKRGGRRSRHEVTVYYPVVMFRTESGAHCLTVSQTGYDKQPACTPGATVELLYDAADPRRATIKDASILMRPGFFLLALLWALWQVWKFYKLWREERLMKVIEVESSSKESAAP
ncbi:MAG: DUF3592 domain-containing protein [Akkermansiaceae bacterium]|nr:DUF3592 domain-containing protein [Akkermansiaceae bacterium]